MKCTIKRRDVLRFFPRVELYEEKLKSFFYFASVFGKYYYDNALCLTERMYDT